jgi:hypothetical protein
MSLYLLFNCGTYCEDALYLVRCCCCSWIVCLCLYNMTTRQSSSLSIHPEKAKCIRAPFITAIRLYSLIVVA